MHVSAAHQGSEPVVNQVESNGNLPPCVHCQESDSGSLSSPRVVLDLMVLSIHEHCKDGEQRSSPLVHGCNTKILNRQRFKALPAC